MGRGVRASRLGEPRRAALITTNYFSPQLESLTVDLLNLLMLVELYSRTRWRHLKRENKEER